MFQDKRQSTSAAPGDVTWAESAGARLQDYTYRGERCPDSSCRVWIEKKQIGRAHV